MPDDAAPVRPRNIKGNKGQKPEKSRQKRKAGPRARPGARARKSTAPVRFVTEGIGWRLPDPSVTKTGHIRSLAARRLSDTMARVHGCCRVRRMRVRG